MPDLLAHKKIPAPCDVGMPYFILNPFPFPRPLSTRAITNGTSCGQVFWLPDQPPAAPSHLFEDSDVKRPLSPVTAAGPRRTCTVFPIAFKGRPAGMAIPIIQRTNAVKGNVPYTGRAAPWQEGQWASSGPRHSQEKSFFRGCNDGI